MQPYHDALLAGATVLIHVCVLPGQIQALEEAGRDGSRVIKIFTARKIEVVMDALKQLNSVLEDGERPVIIGFGTDIVEYIAMGIHQLYPEWIGNVDIAGFAMGGTKEKLEWTVRLLLRIRKQSQFVRQSF